MSNYILIIRIGTRQQKSTRPVPVYVTSSAAEPLYLKSSVNSEIEMLHFNNHDLYV